MTEARNMLSLAEDYLSERRALGFDLGISGDQIIAFSRFIDEVGHTGPLTSGITLDWVQGQAKHAAPFSWARRLDVLRPFAKYLTRLNPATEFPQTAIFGSSHRRLTPHIYSSQEICDLLSAARRPAPCAAWWIATGHLRDDIRVDRRHRPAPFGSASLAMWRRRS